MNKKKKIIIIAVAAVLLIAAAATAVYFLKSSDKEDVPTLSETVESRVAAYRTDLRDSMASMTDQKSVAEYLYTWAQNKGIDSKIDNNNNVIYTLPATEGFEEKAPLILVSEFDYTCMDTYENSIVSAFTAAKNDEPHGEYSIVFISREKGSLDAASALSDKYFTEGCQVIYLGSSTTSRTAAVTGGSEEYRLEKDLSYVQPEYDSAYTISISGLPAQSFSSDSVHDPNAIKIIGDLLANFKSTSMLFELSSFSGGSDGDMIPSGASVTIVVNDSNVSKFESKMEREIEDFMEDYQEDFPDVSYTCEPTDMPQRVIASQDTESIVSLLYTSPCGIEYKDDNGDIASLVNMGRVTTEGGKFILEASSYSYDGELLAELAETYQTTAGLSGISYELVSHYDPFTIDESNQPFEVSFREAYDTYHHTELESINIPEVTPCAMIYEKNPDMEILAVGVTEKTADNFAGAIITYLQTIEAE